MLTTDQKAIQSYKKHKGVADTNSARAFYEEGIPSPVSVFAQNVYQQGAEIPTTAPNHLNNGETDGVVTRYIDLALAQVPGAPDSFYHANLIDAIPFNFGDGSYNYMTTVKDSLGGALPPAFNDFEIDPVAGVLRFYAGAPPNMPPSISFYGYVGEKGVGGGIQDYQIVVDLTARDAIPTENRKNGTLCYVQAGNVTYQLQGGITNVDWILYSAGPPVAVDLPMVNNTNGQYVLADYNETDTLKIYYRADRDTSFQRGEIQIDYNEGSVYYTEIGGSLAQLGITIDFNIVGDDIVLDWVLSDNVDDAVLSFIVGQLISSGSGTPEGGDMYKAVYDPTNRNADAFNMDNHYEGINNRHFTDTFRTKLIGIEEGAEVNPIDTDEVPEGSTSLYHTEARVNAASDVAANSAVRHSHTNKAVLDNITSEGSGSVITAAERTKLGTITEGAEANQTDAEIKTQYENNANTNAFTDTEKSKLAGLQDSKDLGQYTSLAALELAHPNPATGSYANVDGGVGQDVIRYLWDTDDAKYVEQLGESTAETAVSIKSKYESNPDTNVFLDSEKTKLGTVQSGAQVNPTDTDALSEGSTNLYYTEGRVSANTDVAANTAARHSHTNKTTLDNITDAGSGSVITTAERTKLDGIAAGAEVNPADTDGLTEGSTNLYHTEARVNAASDVAANTAARHSHTNKAVLDAITDEGSGSVITTAERTKLDGIESGAQVNPTDTDGVSEGSTNLYYTEGRVSANTDVAANTTARHLHANKTDLDAYVSDPLTVIVKAKSDLPTPVAGIITLVDNYAYHFVGLINIGTDKIVFGENNKIFGTSTLTDIIQYTGTASALNATDEDMILDTITVTCPAGKAITATDSTLTKNLDIFALVIQQAQGLGELSGFYRVSINRCYYNYFNWGWELIGDLSIVMIIDNHADMNRYDGTGGVTFIDQQAGVTITDAPALVRCHIHTRNTGDYILYMDATATVTEGLIASNLFTLSAGSSVTNFDANDRPEIVVTGNTGLDDFLTKGSLSMEANTTTTTIAAVDTWTKILGTTVLGVSSKITMPVSNRLTYIGTRTVDVLVALHLSAEKLTSGDVSLEFSLFKNGVRILNILSARSFSVGDTGSIALGAGISLSENDYLEVFVQNTTNADDLIVSNMQLTLG